MLALNRIGSLGRNTLAQTDGQSVLELALTLPVLLMILTGIATFSIAMNNYLVMTEATSVAARQIAISRQQTADPCATAVNAFYTAAPTLTQSKLTFTYTFNGNATSGTSCPSQSANLKQGMPATLNVSYPCNLTAYNWKFGSACNLQAQTTEVIQ